MASYKHFPQQFQLQEELKKKHFKTKLASLTTQNEESHDHRSDVIDSSDQKFLWKAFKIIVLMKRLIDRCKKAKFFIFLAPTELQEALELLLHQEQHKVYHAPVKR